MATDEDVKEAKNDRKVASINRQSKIDILREWALTLTGGTAIPIGVAELAMPELLPIVLSEPISATGMLVYGVGAFFGPSAYRRAIDIIKQMD